MQTKQYNFIQIQGIKEEPKKMRTLENKPFWWTVYTIYCMIPVSIYVWFLWRKTKEVTTTLCKQTIECRHFIARAPR